MCNGYKRRVHNLSNDISLSSHISSFFCGLHHSSGSHQEKVGEDREQTKAVKKLDNRQQGDARKG